MGEFSFSRLVYLSLSASKSSKILLMQKKRGYLTIHLLDTRRCSPVSARAISIRRTSPGHRTVPRACLQKRLHLCTLTKDSIRCLASSALFNSSLRYHAERFISLLWRRSSSLASSNWFGGGPSNIEQANGLFMRRALSSWHLGSNQKTAQETRPEN